MYTLHVVLTGLIAFANISASTEVMALFVRANGHAEYSHSGIAHHYPFLELGCDGLEIKREDGKYEKLRCDLLERNVRVGFDTLSRRISLDGYDVKFRLDPEHDPGALEKLDCKDNEVRPGYCKKCEPGVPNKTGDLCSFDKNMLSMRRLQKDCAKARSYLLTPDALCPEGQELLVDRLFLKGGVLGTILPAQKDFWKVSYGDAAQKDYLAPEYVRWDFPAGLYVIVDFVPHVPDKDYPFSLRLDLKSGDKTLIFSNEPDLDELCADPHQIGQSHFDMYYGLSTNEHPSIPLFLYPTLNFSVECWKRDMAQKKDGSGGKYPVVCLHPTFDGP